MSSLYEFSSLLKKNTKLHGNHNENDQRVRLRAGRLSMFYENGSLRYISMGNHEIIRMIYSAVRDKEWLTINPVITREKFEIHPDSFRIEYHCRYRSGELNFSARYLIEGHSDNSLVFSFEGEALGTFEKSRIGFCVLHPVEGCAGKSCIITHSEGNTETLTFPVHISPDQPFSDIKSMKWKIADSGCTLVFSGDLFETEDQRNWTDASYKTYCTPQSLPCPATIQKGEKITQSIEFKTEGGVISEKEGKDEITITINPDQIFSLPLIGIGRSTRPAPLTEKEISVLKTLNFDHYRADLYLFDINWRHEADMAAGEAAALEYSLELALFFDNNSKSQLEDFVNWVYVRQPRISVISLYHKTESSTPDRLPDTIAPLLKKNLTGVRIGCGTNANFAQLDRNIPVSDYSDYICYSIHPQEHASDNATMVENLLAQSDSVESARHYSGGKGIWISPVNLQRRFNANIENYEIPVTGDSLPPQVDNRLMSLFGACWTAGSLKYLCESGANGVTFFETTGERGIIQGDYPSRWPEMFQSASEMIFPAYFVFQYLLKFKSYKVIKSECSHPLKVNNMILSDGKYIKLLLINFSSVQQQVDIKGWSGSGTMKQLYAENFAEAVSDCNWIENAHKMLVNANEHLLLEPFSVNFIDGDFLLKNT